MLSLRADFVIIVAASAAILLVCATTKDPVRLCRRTAVTILMMLLALGITAVYAMVNAPDDKSVGGIAVLASLGGLSFSPILVINALSQDRYFLKRAAGPVLALLMTIPSFAGACMLTACPLTQALLQ